MENTTRAGDAVVELQMPIPIPGETASRHTPAFTERVEGGGESESPVSNARPGQAVARPDSTDTIFRFRPKVAFFDPRIIGINSEMSCIEATSQVCLLRRPSYVDSDISGAA